ncbi:ribonuclease H-like domain-containing protein [Favolaschia claudopus]|uniref:Ribonuclease H-like domain-containing protein n=1 Tax=Favolaschia claudopus TaxID=2862362 RepID=A0AAW0C2Y7_9AGAR
MQNTHELFDRAALTVVSLGNAIDVVVSTPSTRNSTLKADILQPDRGQHGLFVCVVQIATQSHIFVLDMTQIRVCPDQLRRILVDPLIAKCGVGLDSDAKMIWYDFAIEAYRLIDLGWMIKIAFPIYYRNKAGCISLQHCVADVLHCFMNKEEQTTTWDVGLAGNSSSTQSLVNYAALDAQAGHELYAILIRAIEVTSDQRQTFIPEDWYAYNFVGGQMTRMERNLSGMHEKWSFKVCRWYRGAVITNFWP